MSCFSGVEEISLRRARLPVDADSHVAGEIDPLDGLVALAEQGDGPTFAWRAAQIAWENYPPQAIADAVHLALSVGASLTARQLSAEGQHLYPKDAELAKLARILAPPRVTGTCPADPSANLDLEWLRRHAAEYRGQWVALKQGEFLATAPSAQALKALLPPTQGIFVTRVL